MTFETDDNNQPIFHKTAFETPQARLAASRLSVVERQWMIENLLVEYHTFNVGLAHIRRAHMPFKDGKPSAGKIRGLLGESRAGKSDICRYYAATHPCTTLTIRRCIRSFISR